MARSKTTPSPLYPKIGFAFIDHPITVWAGVILLRLYVELIRLRTILEATLVPFAKRSNNQIPAPDVLLAWVYGLALGAERFVHFTRFRREPLLSRLLGLPRFPLNSGLNDTVFNPLVMPAEPGIQKIQNSPGFPFSRE